MPEGEDDQHGGQQGRRLGELAGELQQPAERGPFGDDDQQLAGHQAAPRERPALGEPGDVAGQGRGQHDVAVERHRTRAEDLPEAHERRGHVVDAGDDPVGDAGGRAEDDDEQDGLLVEAEQQDGQREPGDAGHGLQPGDQRPDGHPQRADLRHRDAHDGADHQGHERTRRRPGAGSWPPRTRTARCPASPRAGTGSRPARPARTAGATRSTRPAARWPGPAGPPGPWARSTPRPSAGSPAHAECGRRGRCRCRAVR